MMAQIVLPTGRTSWGFDWHGASLTNALNAVGALSIHLYGCPDRSQYQIDQSRLVVAGHSNGGQGAWYLASHYPDKVIGGTIPLNECTLTCF